MSDTNKTPATASSSDILKILGQLGEIAAKAERLRTPEAEAALDALVADCAAKFPGTFTENFLAEYRGDKATLRAEIRAENRKAAGDPGPASISRATLDRALDDLRPKAVEASLRLRFPSSKLTTLADVEKQLRLKLDRSGNPISRFKRRISVQGTIPTEQELGPVGPDGKPQSNFAVKLALFTVDPYGSVHDIGLLLSCFDQKSLDAITTRETDGNPQRLAFRVNGPTGAPHSEVVASAIASARTYVIDPVLIRLYGVEGPAETEFLTVGE